MGGHDHARQHAQPCRRAQALGWLPRCWASHPWSRGKVRLWSLVAVVASGGRLRAPSRQGSNSAARSRSTMPDHGSVRGSFPCSPAFRLGSGADFPTSPPGKPAHAPPFGAFKIFCITLHSQPLQGNKLTCQLSTGTKEETADPMGDGRPRQVVESRSRCDEAPRWHPLR